MAALSASGGAAELVERVAELESGQAELLAELSGVRTDLQAVLSHLQHGGRGREETGS